MCWMMYGILIWSGVLFCLVINWQEQSFSVPIDYHSFPLELLISPQKSPQGINRINHNSVGESHFQCF